MGTRSSSRHQPNRLNPSISPREGFPGSSRRLYFYDYEDRTIVAPDFDDVREYLRRTGSDEFAVSVSIDQPSLPRFSVAGRTTIHRSHGDIVVSESELTCSECVDEPCEHVHAAAREVRRQVYRAPGPRSQHARTYATVTDWLTNEYTESERRQNFVRAAWPDEPDVSYTHNFAAFQADYTAARARHQAGEQVVPYLRQDATAGLGSRETGRGFGVELEFDFDMSVDDDYAAMRAISRDLHQAGLTRQAGGAEGYHAAARRGYSDDPAGWSLEQDASVGGELVSPILYDEPRTWRDLETACEIIRRHGGRPTISTGSHVHVSLHDYDHSVANHNQLLAMINGYQDTLYRLASNPQRHRHRGTFYCRPNSMPSSGYSDVAQARHYNQGHGIGVNLQAVYGREQDHIEGRIWDGTLDPAIIQSQIKLSLGITDAAFRTADTDWRPPTAEPLGAHRNRNPDRQALTGQEWQNATASYRDLIDRIYHRAIDKAQATALFATTRWLGRSS